MNKLLVFFLCKSLIAVGAVLAISYSAACWFLFANQGKFIFFPARAIETTPDALQLKYQDVWLPVPTPTGATEYVHGWWIPASHTSPNPSLAREGATEAVRPGHSEAVTSPTPPNPPLLRGGAREGVVSPV
ncbi:MAG: hypothetical protein ACRC62_24125, partial [Microcoleus sp.]